MAGRRVQIAVCALGAALLGGALATSAHAQTRYIDPSVLGPNARQRALYGPLGDTDPWGLPTAAGCKWSRMQVPTSQGLRWMAMEDCDPDMWH